MSHNKKVSPPIGLGLSRDYFSKNMIPSPPVVTQISYSSASALLHYDGIDVFYVQDGKGTFCVNGKNYSCKKGSLIMLFFYHITRIIPENGCNLQLYRCKFTTNTLMYFLAHPCCIHPAIGLSENPVVVSFEKDEEDYISALFSDMKKELSANSSFHNDMSIFILMELIARIDRTLS